MIAALDQTRKDAKKMRESIRSRTAEFEEARRKAADLMKTLTQRATSPEKLKARVRFQAGVMSKVQVLFEAKILSKARVRFQARVLSETRVLSKRVPSKAGVLAIARV